MNDGPKLLEAFYEAYCKIRFNFHPVRLDDERNLTIFQSVCFYVALAQLCALMSERALKINYKKVILESYGR